MEDVEALTGLDFGPLAHPRGPVGRRIRLGGGPHPAARETSTRSALPDGGADTGQGGRSPSSESFGAGDSFSVGGSPPYHLVAYDDGGAERRTAPKVA